MHPLELDAGAGGLYTAGVVAQHDHDVPLRDELLRLESQDVDGRHERLEEFGYRRSTAAVARHRQVGRPGRTPRDGLVEQRQYTLDVPAPERLVGSLNDTDILFLGHKPS